MHGEYSYASPTHNESRLIPNALEKQRTLSQFNGRIGFRDIPLPAAGISMDFEVYGYNILNKQEMSYGYAIGSPDFTVGLRGDAGGSGYPYAPRTFGVLTKVHF